MATQPITPVANTKPHPSIQAPAGTKVYTTASCQRSDGSDPFLVFPVPANHVRGTPAGGTEIRRVPAAVAAELLAWHPEPTLQPRLATDAEVTTYLAANERRNITA